MSGNDARLVWLVLLAVVLPGLLVSCLLVGWEAGLQAPVVGARLLVEDALEILGLRA